MYPSRSLEFLANGMSKGLNDIYPTSFPEWFELNKFIDGQRFAQNHYFSISYSEFISLYLLFGLKSGAKPLIFTGKSDLPGKALARYYSTIKRVSEWYEGDVEDFEGKLHQNLKTVRLLHKKVSMEMANLQPEALEEMTCRNKVGAEGMLSQWTEQSISENLRLLTHPNPSIQNTKIDDSLPNLKYIGQLDTSLTLFGFMGLITLYPEKFGVHNMTEKDAEGFIHFWKTIGFFLGVNDEYNFCNGSVAEVKERVKDALETIFIPYILHTDENWEQLSRALAYGMKMLLNTVSFESSFLYLCWVLELQLSPYVYKTIAWNHYFKYWLNRFVTSFVLRSTFLRRCINYYVKQLMNDQNRLVNSVLSQG